MFFIGRKKIIKMDFPDYQRLVSEIRRGKLMKEEFFKTPYPTTDFSSDSKSCDSKHTPQSSSKSAIQSDSESEIKSESIRTPESHCDKQITNTEITTTAQCKPPEHDLSEDEVPNSINSKSHQENM